MEEIVLRCRGVTEGKARGMALVTTQPISFWGGINPKTGLIIDRRNELYGKSISGKVFVFPYAKGSSTSSAVFLEAVRCRNAPAGIVNIETEPLLAVGAIIAEKLYRKSIPIVDHVEVNPLKVIRNNDLVELDASKSRIRVKRTPQTQNRA